MVDKWGILPCGSHQNDLLEMGIFISLSTLSKSLWITDTDNLDDWFHWAWTGFGGKERSKEWEWQKRIFLFHSASYINVLKCLLSFSPPCFQSLLSTLLSIIYFLIQLSSWHYSSSKHNVVISSSCVLASSLISFSLFSSSPENHRSHWFLAAVRHLFL